MGKSGWTARSRARHDLHRWILRANNGASRPLAGVGGRPDYHAALEAAWRERRAFGASATRFEVVNAAGEVAHRFEAADARRWAEFRERRAAADRGEIVAEIPQPSGFGDVGAAPVGIESLAAGILATPAPWEA